MMGSITKCPKMSEISIGFVDETAIRANRALLESLTMPPMQPSPVIDHPVMKKEND